MLKNLIVLANGTEISSGAGTSNAIRSHTLTACVNDADELSLGSVCANALEMTLFSPSGNLSLTAGDEVTLYKVDDAGNRVKKGIFILEKPTRPTANTTKITGYDRITKLDKDLTVWLNGLTGWPYTLATFAGMVCEACGLTLATTDVPNSDFLVYQFTKSGVTGRQIMKWIGEICCRFCRANADGEIEFAWYTPSGITIAPTGDRYFFPRALSYETYQVAPVEAVQIRLADSSNGALWPEAEEGANSYVITGNAIFMARVTEDLLPYLQVIEAELDGVTYTPCKVSLPASLDIDAGSIVDITDKNGATISAYVMTKATTGQKDTLECTGSRRRDSSTAVNNRKPSVDQAARDAFAGLTHAQVFAKLTDNGKIQGIYAQDNTWYVNAEVAQIINLKAENIDTTNLKVSAANITGTITASKVVVKNTSGATLLSAGDNAVVIAGWKADSNSLYSGDSFSSAECFICTGSSASMSIGGSDKISGWMIKAGSKFGVTKAGALYGSDVNLTGKIIATSGRIGEWSIINGMALSTVDAENGNAIGAVWIEPYALRYIYNQAGGDGIATPWQNVVKAGISVGNGKTTTVTISGKTYTFTDGILTDVA